MNIKNWFGKKQEIERVEPVLNKDDERIAEKMASLDPWVEIVGETEDPEKGVRIELNWNAPFIEMLKSHGFTGDDEDHIVQKWLVSINAQMVRDMEDQAIEERGDGKDYV